EVELHVREPACAGHPVAIDQRGFKVTAGADAAELPHQRPELLRMADGEIVERLVAADVGIASGLAHETNKPMQVGGIPAFGAWDPQRCVARHARSRLGNAGIVAERARTTVPPVGSSARNAGAAVHEAAVIPDPLRSTIRNIT